MSRLRVKREVSIAHRLKAFFFLPLCDSFESTSQNCTSVHTVSLGRLLSERMLRNPVYYAIGERDLSCCFRRKPNGETCLKIDFELTAFLLI